MSLRISKQRWIDAQKSEFNFWQKKSLDERLQFLEKRYKKILRSFEKRFMITNKSKILDVGCGPYPVCLFFQRGEKYGIDPLVEQYKKLYTLPKGIHFKKGIGEKIPWSNHTFDIVICCDVLDHTKNPNNVLAEIRRVLKSEGYLLLSVHFFSSFLVSFKKIVEFLKLPLREKNASPFFY